jgi:hypothetical protein
MFNQNQVKVILKQPKLINNKMFHHLPKLKILNKLNQLQYQQHQLINQQKGDILLVIMLILIIIKVIRQLRHLLNVLNVHIPIPQQIPLLPHHQHL